MKSNENFYKRLSELSGIKKESTPKSRVNESAELVEFFRSKDKTAYGVIREGHNYYIKKSTKLSEDLSAPDFSHINGIANKADYKYDTLNRAQKNAKLFVESINEAFDLGVAKKPQRKSAPSLNVGNDINSFISNRLAESKDELRFKKQEKFKSSLKEQKENIDKIKKGQLPESADLAIKRALGKINEEDLVTKDSEIKDSDSVNKSGQSKEEAQAPINDKNAKSKADSKSAKGGSFDKASQPSSLSVNEEDLSTADSEIKDSDSVNRKQSKETPDAPVNDTNAKSQADSRDAKSGNTMDKKPSQPKSLSVDESEQALSTMDSQIDKDELNYPKGEFGDGKIKGAKELDNLILADSEIDSDGSMANQDNATKESSQSPVNDTNAKSLADKAVAEGKEGEPFKEKTKDGGKSTEDSDQSDADRVDNKTNKEKVDSYNSHYDVKMAHKEKKGEKLKPKASKKDIVAESEGEPVDRDMERTDVSEPHEVERPQTKALKDAIQAAGKTIDAVFGEESEEINKILDDAFEYVERTVVDGVYEKDEELLDAMKNADVEDVIDEADGEEDIDAAADALDDLENADTDDAEQSEMEMGAEPKAEKTPEAPAEGGEGEEDIDIDIDGLDLDGDAEEGSEEQTDEPSEEEPEAEEGGEETEIDSESDSDELMKKEIEKMIGKLTYKVRNIDLEPTQAKSFMNSLIDAFKKDLSDIEVIDRKEMADEILKVEDQPDEEMADAEEVEENLEVYEDETPDDVSDDERMSFGQYAESRGYTSEELHECGSEEKANLMSGYIDEMNHDLRESDCEEMGSYADDDVMNELSEYGHNESVEKLVPYKKAVKEADVTYGMHEPMVDPSINEDDDIDELEVEDEVEDAAGFAPLADNMGINTSKGEKTVRIDLNSDTIDVNVNEAEEKVRKYTIKKLKELAEGKRITMNESKKSEKMKKLDRIIESEYKKIISKMK